MIKATCIEKFKKNNRIYGYRLQDSQGNTQDITSDQLKTAIKNGQITILNLTLTSDNRLVDTTPTPQSHQESQVTQISDEEQKVKNLIAKARLLGLQAIEIPTYRGPKCHLISKSETNHIIYIPDNIKRLNKALDSLTFTRHIQELQGVIKVIGGHNLTDVKYMFAGCQAQSIDLSSFDTSNVTDMGYMFSYCNVKSIDLSSFNTSKVTDMNKMFSHCNAQSLDLSSFNTSNVTNMESMFESCRAKPLDLSSFNTSKVTNMTGMFHKYKTYNPHFIDPDRQVGCIDLSSFDTSNVIDMWYMFKECLAQIKATDIRILNAYEKGR